MFALNGGKVSEYKSYLPIMNAFLPAPKVLLADIEYDVDLIRADMEKRCGVAIITTKRNHLIQLPIDGAIYALRNMVERCFNKLKNAHTLATRYVKTAGS
jgi:transposase